MSEILKTTIFQVKVLFPHTLKTPETRGFEMFSGWAKRENWYEMVEIQKQFP